MITCIFENGHHSSKRHVVVDVLVINDGQILMVKRAKGLEIGKWGIVGGYVDRDETITDAAKREVFEETGYRIHDLKLLTIRDNPDRPHEDR